MRKEVATDLNDLECPQQVKPEMDTENIRMGLGPECSYFSPGIPTFWGLLQRQLPLSWEVPEATYSGFHPREPPALSSEGKIRKTLSLSLRRQMETREVRSTMTPRLECSHRSECRRARCRGSGRETQPTFSPSCQGSPQV